MSESSSQVTMTTGDVAPALAQYRWVMAIVTASAIAWIGYNYPPYAWRIPDDMIHIGALSPADDQARLKVVESHNMWMNTLLKFGLAGAGMGLAGFFLNGFSALRYLQNAILTLLSGIAAGCLAGVSGLLLRQYLNLDRPIPMISEQMRPLFADALVFMVASTLLLLPIAVLLLLQPDPQTKHKAGSIPLAGILAGIFVPFLVALIASHTSTSVFPPSGLVLTILWFSTMCLLSLILLALTGKRPANKAARS
ncbi:MAG: hypothetical protein ABI557_06720 [Aureliella sp.]